MQLAQKSALRTLTLLLSTLYSLLPASAQDSRHVTEPTFPTACTVLPAQLSIVAGQPSSETAFDTKRIQSAMNSCKRGQAVELIAANGNNAFLSQPLDIPSGITLLIDGGVTVFASRNPADYQRGTPGGSQLTCGTVIPGHGIHPNGCVPFLTVNHNQPSSGSGIMGYGVIDGRGNQPMLVNGKPGPSWYDNTHATYLPGTNTDVNTQNNVYLIVPHQASDFTLYKITLRNSPFIHVRWEGPAHGFTAWGVKVITPATVPNNDAIDPVDDMKDVTIANSYLSTGDDDVAITANSPGKPVSNITLSNLHLYGGDGISIGSGIKGGVTDVLADHIYAQGNLSALAGGQAGIKVKSGPDRGNLVTRITYQNFCIQNQKYSIQFELGYKPKPGAPVMIPTYKDIAFHNITVLANSNGDGNAGGFQFEGYDADHITSVLLDNVIVEGKPQIRADHNHLQFAHITLGPGPVSDSLKHLSGPSVTYATNITNPNEKPFSCTASDFPSLVGELYLSTPTATNQQSLTIKPNIPVTLNAVVEEVTAELPHPTLSIAFFEGTKSVGTATLSGNGTLATLTLSNLTPGTHTFTAAYPKDTHYPNPGPLNFGSVTVTVQ